MKNIAIMQPYLFPYIGYFQLIKIVDEYVIYDDVQYITRGWVNRNNILVNGNRHLFTISLKEASSNKKIKDIEIADDFVKFTKTINAAYGKAPYYAQVKALIEDICQYEDKNLANFTTNSIQKMCDYVGVKTQIKLSSEIDKNDELKAQPKIIDICKRLNASHYINPIGGQELYNKDDFLNENIKLSFIKSNIKEYKQFKNDFIPGLSIIDVLMFNSPEEVNSMLDDYELI